jgi:SCY1-like protein 2
LKRNTCPRIVINIRITPRQEILTLRFSRQELSGVNGSRGKGTDDFMSFGATSAFPSNNGDSAEVDFERLVKGTAGDSESNPLDAGWNSAPSNAAAQPPPRNVSTPPNSASFSWSTPQPTPLAHSGNIMDALKPQQGPTLQTATPDLSRFDALAPTTTQFSRPLQPQPFQSQATFNAPSLPNNYNPTPILPPPQPQSFQSLQSPPATSVNWGAAAATTASPWDRSSSSNNTQSMNFSMVTGLGNSMASMSMNQQRPAVNSQPS